MRPFLLLLFLFLSIVPPLPAAPDQRILLIAAPSLNDDAYRTQAVLLLPALAGLNERDFVVQIQFGTKSFSVVLIGKDGGENSVAPPRFRPKNSSPSSTPCPCAAPKCAGRSKPRYAPAPRLNVAGPQPATRANTREK